MLTVFSLTSVTYPVERSFRLTLDLIRVIPTIGTIAPSRSTCLRRLSCSIADFRMMWRSPVTERGVPYYKVRFPSSTKGIVIPVPFLFNNIECAVKIGWWLGTAS